MCVYVCNHIEVQSSVKSAESTPKQVKLWKSEPEVVECMIGRASVKYGEYGIKIPDEFLNVQV